MIIRPFDKLLAIKSLIDYCCSCRSLRWKAKDKKKNTRRRKNTRNTKHTVRPNTNEKTNTNTRNRNQRKPTRLR